MFKCIGHQYSTTDPNENVNTLYIAIPVHYVTSAIDVGDVIVGNHSNGFLERVNEVRQDHGRTFIRTELTRCADNVRIRFVQGRRRRGGRGVGKGVWGKEGGQDAISPHKTQGVGA